MKSAAQTLFLVQKLSPILNLRNLVCQIIWPYLPDFLPDDIDTGIFFRV